MSSSSDGVRVKTSGTAPPPIPSPVDRKALTPREILGVPAKGGLPGRGTPPSESPACRRILLVDDEDGFRSALAEVLGGAGYQIFEGVSFEQGWRLLEAETFDVVIAEWRLRGGCGLRLLREAKARRPGVRLIALSVTAPPKGAQGVDEWFEKPLELRRLVETVRRLSVAAGSLKTTDPPR